MAFYCPGDIGKQKDLALASLRLWKRAPNRPTQKSSIGSSLKAVRSIKPVPSTLLFVFHPDTAGAFGNFSAGGDFGDGASLEILSL